MEEARRAARVIGVSWRRVSYRPEDLRKGMNVELEHGLVGKKTNVTFDDPITTARIALAHLEERSDYYEQLERAERAPILPHRNVGKLVFGPPTLESGVLFATGKKVVFPFLHNDEKAPYLGTRFQQDIEPAGMYVQHVEDDGGELVRGWSRGVARLRHPLVVSFHLDDDVRYDAKSWKAMLHRAFGKTGKALTRALLSSGYDGIVTVGPYGTREIVLLVPTAVLG